MSKRIFAIFLSLVMVVGLMPAMAFAETEPAEDYGKPGKDYVEGQAIVCLKGTTSTAKLAKQKGMGDFEFESLMKIDGDSESETEAAGAKAKSSAVDSKVLALVDSDESTADLIKKLEQNPQVEYAEPNYIIKPSGVEPTDRGYPYQWHLKNRINEGSINARVPAADTNISKAWEKADASGISEKAVVAVVDSGIDYTHPDLKEIMWDDGLKIPALTAMGGGKYGYNTNDPFYWDGQPTGEKSDDPMDVDHGHGTHCAGIIASQWNQQGTAGVNGKNIELMAIRMLGSTATTVGAVRGYAYIQTAAENGVNVVAANNSWGPGSYNGLIPRSVMTAVDAVGEKYGIISCFGSGNAGTNVDLNTGFPCNGKYAINVGAMDSTGEVTSFSCYGKRTVDVFAPGSQILSTTTTSKSVPQEMISIPKQYLPQMMDKDQSWFYEDFEDEEDQVTLRLLDEDGRLIAGGDTSSGPGASSSRSLQIPLNAIPEGAKFSIGITVPKEALTEIGPDDDIYMAFQGGCDNALYGQKLYLEYLNRSGEWERVKTKTMASGEREARLRLFDHNWDQASYQIKDPKVFDTKKIRMRLVPDGKMTRHIEGKPPVFRVDNVGVGKSTVPYHYADGTSMAAPIVTGLAGLLATNTDLTSEEIIARIKGGVNRRDAIGLKDKSVSDGFIDAAAAFDKTKCVPVLNELQGQGDSAVLKGYFFGDAKGTLSIGGKTIDASKWTDKEITFTMPEDMTGMQEVRVIRAGMDAEMDYGKNFFTVKQENLGFQSLTAPNNSYGKMEDGEIMLTSADCLPIDMAAADGKIACISCIIENEKIVMELYDIASDSWKQIDLPKDIVFLNMAELYSLTAGKDKLYLSYISDKGTINLGIYDLKTGTWKTAAETDLYGWETLEVYQDKLLAIGGQKITADGEGVPVSTVKILDPNTGKVIGKLPNMPEARHGVKASASGDKLYVCGSYDICSEGLHYEYQRKYNNVLVYDGKKWTAGDEPFFSEEYAEFDKMQTLNYGLGAADNGLFAVGPVKNLDGKDMQDTWFYDAEKNTWSSREDIRYCTMKTERNIGVSYDGSFYVLSWTGLQKEPIVFRELPGVSYTGPKDQLITQPAAPKIKAESSLTSTKLSWSKVSGATGYEIYRASSKNGTYKKVFTTTKQSWTNTGLSTGKTNYYKVRAYKKSGNATIYGKYSGWLAATPKPAVPAFKLSALDNGAKVSWSKVSGASGYKIYRATSKNGTYKLIKTAKSTDRSYTSKKLKDKKTYYYKLRSYKVVNGKNVYSKYSIVKSIRTK